jgi:hypothetical protein
MEPAEDFDEAEAGLVATENGAGAARLPGAQWLLTRRRIEQAREQRELSRSLEDFEDYVI